MSKVFIGVGHGGADPGAVGYIKEADVNLGMALGCRDYLVANGVEVKMSRTRDENDPLTQEIRECNAYAPNLAVDIHNNAGGGDGFEVYHSIFTGVSTVLAKNIESEVIAMGQNSRGCKTRKAPGGNYDYFGFIREIRCPSVICEGVFVDNAADAAQADTLEEQRNFGIAIAKGILKTLHITPNNNIPQPTPQPSKSIDELAREVIAGKHGSGEARRRALGSLYDQVQARVNEILGGKKPAAPSLKPLDVIAQEVINGLWGNGNDRRNRLVNAGYNYEQVQQAVNAKLGQKPASNRKSNETIANEVIAGLWGNGADRKNRLTRAGYDYETIRAIVNRKLR